MRRRLALALVLVLAGGLLVLTSGPAQAVGEPETGWWSRLATTTPTEEAPVAIPVPAPTTPDTVPVGATVPEGQLLVEGTPEGATAIAAARWMLDAGESSPSLTLPIAPGSSLSPESIVLACKASFRWQAPAGPGGPWDSKPLVDAARCVNGAIADDLSSVAFGLQPLVSNDVLDVVFVPGRIATSTLPPGVPEPPADLDGSAFRWMFDAPTAESLELVAGDFTEGEGDTVVSPPPPPAPTEAGSGAPATAAPVAAPLPTAPVAPAEPVATPALEAQDLAPSVPDLASTPAAAVDAGSVDRTIGVVLLLLAGLAAAWAMMTSPESEAIGLGRFRTAATPVAAASASVAVASTPVTGGLGRFRKDRTSPAPPLT